MNPPSEVLRVPYTDQDIVLEFTILSMDGSRAWPRYCASLNKLKFSGFRSLAKALSFKLCLNLQSCTEDFPNTVVLGHSNSEVLNCAP